MDTELLWQHIVRHQGETFYQKRGKAFTYHVRGNALVPSTTNQQIPKSQFAQAIALLPLDGPGQTRRARRPERGGWLTNRRASPAASVWAADWCGHGIRWVRIRLRRLARA